MNRKFSLLYLILSGCLCTACVQSRHSGTGNSKIRQLTVVIDPSQQYQQIDNFGASDAWACQFVGEWPDQKKNIIADLLFSLDTTLEGKPKGIGLSLWRFNIGSGSAEQGVGSGIRDEWRRAESFLQADGNYDWEKQAGQQWFLRAARQRGVPQFLAFPNSPPVHMTANHKAYATDGQSNLRPENYAAYADYLANVIRGVEAQTGVSFQYLSPVNEPQWDWSDAGQEGTPFRNGEIAAIVETINTKLERDDLPVSIDVAEAGKINYLYSNADKPERGDQISEFFVEGAPHYIGDLSKVGHVVSAHSYFTTSPDSLAVAMREEVARKVATVPGLKYWMSEYCILGDNAGEIRGNLRDLSMESALYMAQVIHRDLTIANAAAWHWWLAVSPYDYKDGLVYIDKQKEDGSYYESKMLWTLGNYSRFIRPGAVRLAASVKADDSSIFISAFIHPETRQMTMVVVNADQEEHRLKLEFKDVEIDLIRTYTTDEERDLTPGSLQQVDRPVSIAPHSVTTIVGRIE
ncbi:MAG: glycoside hydrolase [Saprospiraceae bacterium]